jgi:hypothetical protein
MFKAEVLIPFSNAVEFLSVYTDRANFLSVISTFDKLKIPYEILSMELDRTRLF